MGSKVQAYDVHAASAGEPHIHFQVLVPTDTSLDDAKKFAETYLKSFAKTGKLEAIAKTGSTQGATNEQESSLAKNGHYIYKVHGCPQEEEKSKPTKTPAKE